jgi:putative ABC transport system substrate-binding protein
MERILMNRNFILFFIMCVIPFVGLRAVDNISIGVAWVGKANMQKRVLKGLKSELSKLAPNISITVKGELKNIDELESTYNKFQKTKSGVVILRSSGAKFLASKKIKIPSFIGGCNHPTSLGVVKNVGRPEGMITGVTYAISYEKIFESFISVLPESKKILLLYEKDHPAAVVDRNGVKKEAGNHNIKYHERGVASKGELLNVVQTWKHKVDAIIIGNQALIFDNTKDIVRNAGMTPLISFSLNAVKDGALFSLGANDFRLGEMLAKKIVEVIIHKVPISEVPIGFDLMPQIFINIDSAKRLDVTIPMHMLKIAEVVR